MPNIAAIRISAAMTIYGIMLFIPPVVLALLAVVSCGMGV
jgi:hypothetical protein